MGGSFCLRSPTYCGRSGQNLATDSKSGRPDTNRRSFGVARVLALVFLGSGILTAEPPQPVTRPAALDQLESAVGVWDSEATCRFSPEGEQFQSKSTRVVKWSANRQFLISDEWLSMPGGWLPKVVITTWDPVKKEFKMINVLSNTSYVNTMTIEGKFARVWGEFNDGKRVIQMWASVEQISDSETKFRCECSVENGPRWLFSEGTSRKRNVE